jgi:hypothetical protein
MYSGMTRGMKAHVSTMLTETDLSIALAFAPLLVPLKMQDARRQARYLGVCFVLTMRAVASVHLESRLNAGTCVEVVLPLGSKLDLES